MADYYWSRDWTDWDDYEDDDERADVSADRLQARCIRFRISPCIPLKPYVRSERQENWELSQGDIANARFFRALRRS